MKVTGSYLFVYGTLLVSGNNYAAYLQKHCTLIGEGKIRGTLYDIGEYPGAIIDTDADQYICGSIYLMDDAESVIRFIDEYEGLGPDEPQPQEYRRSMVDIATGKGIIRCWMYLYNWPLNGFVEVSGGKYVDYVAGKL